MLIHYIVALFASFVYGAAGVINSHLCNYRFNNPATWVFYSSLTNFVFLPFLFFFGTISVPVQQVWGAYLLLAVLMIVTQLPVFLAYKENDASVVNALWSFGQIALPLFAFVFLGETLKMTQYIGFFIIVAVNIVLNFNPKHKLKLNMAFYYILLCSVLLTLNLVIEKYVLMYDSNWVNLVFYVCLMSTIFSGFFLLLPNVRRDIKASLPVFKKSFAAFSAAELLSFTGHACGIFALAGLAVVPKSALDATEPLFVLLINMILVYKFRMTVRENISKREVIKKTVGYFVLIAGIVLTVTA